LCFSAQGQEQDNANISINTKDWTKKEKAMEVARVIRKLGITAKLTYKPDLYTAVKIFRGNEYNLRPNVFSY
jgi:hypothetical protein